MTEWLTSLRLMSGLMRSKQRLGRADAALRGASSAAGTRVVYRCARTSRMPAQHHRSLVEPDPEQKSEYHGGDVMCVECRTEMRVVHITLVSPLDPPGGLAHSRRRHGDP